MWVMLNGAGCPAAARILPHSLPTGPLAYSSAASTCSVQHSYDYGQYLSDSKWVVAPFCVLI